MRNYIRLGFTAALLAACSRAIHSGSEAAASAVIRSASGDSLGVLTVSPTASGVRLTGDLRRLTAGMHGIHVHTVGMCTAPDFASAGGHLNPSAMKHGLDNPAGPHAGDLPNITANASGQAHVDVSTTHATLAQLMDTDGSAIVVHAAQDDQKTDPAGNSGARVACGVVK